MGVIFCKCFGRHEQTIEASDHKALIWVIFQGSYIPCILLFGLKDLLTATDWNHTYRQTKNASLADNSTVKLNGKDNIQAKS